MSQCGSLSDRMPAVALGASTWTAEEAEHLAICPSCQSEWKLIRLSSRLGQGVGAELDPRAMTRAVLDRLAQRREKARLLRNAWGFAALAGAAAAAMVWAGQTSVTPAAPAKAPLVASLLIPLPELDNLMPAELDAVLQTMDEPDVGGSVKDPSAASPDDEDLESTLDTWEG